MEYLKFCLAIGIMVFLFLMVMLVTQYTLDKFTTPDKSAAQLVYVEDKPPSYEEVVGLSVQINIESDSAQ